MGHRNIHHYDVCTLLAPQTKTRRSIRSLDGIVPSRREHSQDRPADDCLIVYNENPRHKPGSGEIAD
jgi:hypothetical protein